MKKLLLFLTINFLVFSQSNYTVSSYKLLDTLFYKINNKYGNNYIIFTNLSNNAIILEDYLKQKFVPDDTLSYIKIYFENKDEFENIYHTDNIKGFYIITSKPYNIKEYFDISLSPETSNYLTYIIFAAGTVLTYLLFSIR
ncbi:MAG TPA: hypothetical protein PLP99_06570 [Ignavibacteriales bacterium]|nr:hypothetical protein [Ignavibacteriales bacterium]HOL81405.1 hypothetical protein [Ignavibacteriales bacterium]HOM65519.1 hypothetical protein [Ignavibacteriales bacterium]HPP34365.1 hypothetical protein [Ignavibacteriales bacterium]HRR18540.1 hypothetical protein [Ignavibacteriales bacterium]